MNDNELGLELAEIVRKEQEEAAMLHREQKDVVKTNIPKRHKIYWEALTEEEYGSSAVAKNPALKIEKEDADNGRVMNDPVNKDADNGRVMNDPVSKLHREVAKAEEILAQKKNQLMAAKSALLRRSLHRRWRSSRGKDLSCRQVLLRRSCNPERGSEKLFHKLASMKAVFSRQRLNICYQIKDF